MRKPKVPAKPFFISFEGIDGCGKSTQLLKAARFFSDLGYEVVETREPGGTMIGRHLRSLLLEEGAKNQRSELLMFMLDRAEHVRQVILPALQENKVVLCDRFIDSSIAYQSDYSFEQIDWLNNFSTAGLKPDLTFYFDIPLEVALNRRKTRDAIDLIEARSDTYMQNVLARYLKNNLREPQRIKMIPATGSIEDVTEKMKEHLRRLIESKS
jgi:dTMP kinase